MKKKEYKYPGIPTVLDGNTAVVMCEREASEAAGAYPITPSTQMGEYWAMETALGHLNISGDPLIFIEPEGEHAAAAVTAGLSLAGLRSVNFSSGQGIAYMHESLYAAVGKRLTYILNMGCRAMTKATLNVHAGHDDYHAVDDTGFFQLFAKDVQQAADLNVIAHRIAELALTPGIVAQDGFLTTHVMESMRIPERELIAEFLGRPDDIIATPTGAQKILFGDQRRRIPIGWDVDNPVMTGTVQNQESYMQSVAAQRPFFFAHIPQLAALAMDEYFNLTGRRYNPLETWHVEDADYLIVGQGSLVSNAEAVADYLRKTRKVKVGVVGITMFRPFPGAELGPLLKGKKGVVVMERLDQPLAEDLPLMREVRSALGKSLENASAGQKRFGRKAEDLPWPSYETIDSEHMPMLYSAIYGMGSRDLQPEAIIGAVENMLKEGDHHRRFYVSIDFIKKNTLNPQLQIHQQKVEEHYPQVSALAVKGSENPDLMPDGSITVRIHSVGGWGAMATGKNLTMTLADILGFYVKANPKYGSEKKGQPTTYYLSVAPEPIRVNCEFHFVDAVLSPDPNVFRHSNPLAGLKKGGAFIIQSESTDESKVWSSIPLKFRKIIKDNDIRVYYLDAFKIAREEATDAELQYRMQGIAFQGAFFQATRVYENRKLDAEALFKVIRENLTHKFKSKGMRVVEDNLRVVSRGFEEVRQINDTSIDDSEREVILEVLPDGLKLMPAGQDAMTDIHHFWQHTGSFYKAGQGGSISADPFAAYSTIPASTGIFRDMTDIRFEYPEWVGTNCTACGNCYTVCPDSAIPGLVSEPGQVLQTALKLARKEGHELDKLARPLRELEKAWKGLLATSTEKDDPADSLKRAFESVRHTIGGSDKDETVKQLDLMQQTLDKTAFAISRPYYTNHEKQKAGSGGLLSITVNPYACKGCMECVEVCNDDALRPVKQTEDAVNTLRHNWDFYNALPDTPEQYKRIDDLEEGIGALETLLLNKDNYLSMSGGDGACLGCSEKTVLHLFTAATSALMQGRVKKHLAELDELIEKLKDNASALVNLRLENPADVLKAVDSFHDREFTAGQLADALNKKHDPVDTDRLLQYTHVIRQLEDLKYKYTEGTTGRGRAAMGISNATGCSSVWGSTYPLNPYPFPWTNHLFQDSPSMAMGIFEGHMKKMATGFKALRTARLLAEDTPVNLPDLTYFTWKDFTTEEYELCPPVVVVGGDGALYDIGFQNLSRMMMSGMPIKVLALDTQVYSNTGGQACTSGFTGQVSDMAWYGKVWQGKREIRKEIGIIAMAHRTTYVMQAAQSNPAHMLEGFIEGLKSRQPALFNIYCNCPPEHGTGDDVGALQAKMAVESRAYPLFRFNPLKSDSWAECLDLDGNPETEADWPTYSLEYTDDQGQPASLEVPVTFADFALSERRFAKHFRMAPRDTWNDNMVLLSDFLELDADEREGSFPFIWTVDKKGHLGRAMVSESIVASAEDRRHFWRLLKNLGGLDAEEFDREGFADSIRAEMLDHFAESLTDLALHAPEIEGLGGAEGNGNGGPAE